MDVTNENAIQSYTKTLCFFFFKFTVVDNNKKQKECFISLSPLPICLANKTPKNFQMIFAFILFRENKDVDKISNSPE